jgi:hypothetical protein
MGRCQLGGTPSVKLPAAGSRTNSHPISWPRGDVCTSSNTKKYRAIPPTTAFQKRQYQAAIRTGGNQAALMGLHLMHDRTETMTRYRLAFLGGRKKPHPESARCAQTAKSDEAEGASMS